MSERPNFAADIEAELAKSGVTPPDASRSVLADIEGNQEIRKAIDESVGTLEDLGAQPVELDPTQMSEAKRMKALAKLGDAAARELQMFIEKNEMDQLGSVADQFIDAAVRAGSSREQAVGVLQAQLGEYQKTYLEIGRNEKAAEIESFGRSLAETNTVSTEAGKQFVADLDAGKYATLESAMYALDAVKEAASGEDADKLTNEFNVLYKTINDKFVGAEKSDDKLDFSDSDMDEMFKNVG